MSIGWCGIPPLLEGVTKKGAGKCNNQAHGDTTTHTRHKVTGGNHGLNRHEVKKVEAMILAGENRDFICRQMCITRQHLAWIAKRIKPEGK